MITAYRARQPLKASWGQPEVLLLFFCSSANALKIAFTYIPTFLHAAVKIASFAPILCDVESCIRIRVTTNLQLPVRPELMETFSKQASSCSWSAPS